MSTPDPIKELVAAERRYADLLTAIQPLLEPLATDPRIVAVQAVVIKHQEDMGLSLWSERFFSPESPKLNPEAHEH